MVKTVRRDANINYSRVHLMFKTVILAVNINY
jgi:hypothetical protein